jgi:hypothetical protein
MTRVQLVHLKRVFLLVEQQIEYYYYSISFLDLKYLRRYKTCQVARPNRQHMEKIEKYSTLELVDSFVSLI